MGSSKFHSTAQTLQPGRFKFEKYRYHVQNITNTMRHERFYFQILPMPCRTKGSPKQPRPPKWKPVPQSAEATACQRHKRPQNNPQSGTARRPHNPQSKAALRQHQETSLQRATPRDQSSGSAEGTEGWEGTLDTDKNR